MRMGGSGVQTLEGRRTSQVEGYLKQTLVLFFLTLNAVAGPRHRFQALLLDFFLASDT